MILGERKCFAGIGFDHQPIARGCEPIDHLLQVHERLRMVGGMMTILADDPWHHGRERYAQSILKFFNEEWPLHLDDEEYSLMPRLLAHLRNRTGRRLQMALEYEHSLIRQAIMDIGAGLCALSSGRTPASPAAFAVNLMQAEELLFRHIEWEERTIYPLAWKRLEQSDRIAIWREMAERRGLDLC